ncbi:hypothetical protein SCHPADRAFT_401151 [Schizopora paradoxa]|uniref:Uncharacterized protein n=1 Tax=Schizopora paradoxa TaxID=27342 RepID=A0A0H2RMD8_9AGAM|nr:hypothetical protein SCHPADRAFT_401151 [Schizopora paradoxa]
MLSQVRRCVYHQAISLHILALNFPTRASGNRISRRRKYVLLKWRNCLDDATGSASTRWYHCHTRLRYYYGAWGFRCDGCVDFDIGADDFILQEIY